MAKTTPEELTLDDRFARIGDYLVGLWRFRVRGQKPKWCCTYVFDGFYYDTLGDETKEAALDKVHANLKQLIKRHGEKPATPPTGPVRRKAVP